MTPLPVIVYAATGFTGRLIARGARSPRRRLRHRRPRRRQAPRAVGLVALQARDRDRARRRPGSAEEDGRPGPRALELRRAVPALREGGVQDAALQAGAHWLDLTGEFPFLQMTFARDAEARERGVALVNAVGFDIVPTESAAVLACEGLPDVARLRIAIAARERRRVAGPAAPCSTCCRSAAWP